MPERTLFIECISGIAGDMFTSAFLDAGLVSREEIQSIPRLLGWDDVIIEIQEWTAPAFVPRI
jgi:uncharacterized protein (DUF111 family)